MAELIAREGLVAVVGLGQTGLSAVRFLRQLGYAVSVFERDPNAAGVRVLRERYPEVQLHTGEWDVRQLCEASQVLLSPGVPRAHPFIQAALQQGVPVSGDVSWFARYALRPIIAVTGSNGKRTVVSWLAHVLTAVGVEAQAGGNIGIPVLDLLSMPEPGVYVLELSSFQLESLEGMKPVVATVLNVSPDHMDRYDSVAAYTLAKQRIYRGAQHAVINRADPLTQGLLAQTTRVQSFGLDVPDLGQFGLEIEDGERYLCRGATRLCSTRDLALKGDHHICNALAVLAVVEAFGVPSEAVMASLKTFRGLPHRCQVAGSINGVLCYNDSKGTNVGATIAAITGLGPHHRCQGEPGLVLLLGGQGKG
ncbi:MAG: UDP-N-acetylmuramoyl-L-alanine--D-glutamate ligase, partial [Gammaproteobacteria bacterium]